MQVKKEKPLGFSYTRRGVRKSLLVFLFLHFMLTFLYILSKLFPFFGLSGNIWLVSFKISYLCLPLFYETRTTPSCHPSGCAYRQL